MRPGRHPVPRQLPPVTSGFAGRAAELAALDELADIHADASGPAVGVISGTAGVGKTTLLPLSTPASRRIAEVDWAYRHVTTHIRTRA